ncbi:glycosyltransferase [Albimonas pacifica]|uniref:Glycosyltransferase involved in cell wall bisynthesis n=1 Tax=Albimonas pacifica TaxID=1114924 RepID=A0A1I3EN21_9RHOB|nr:glycosyltransferase [Albimonas pacifica]SFI00342.1 Glycosyltransferase involved in cell wall bisynthesis [Albimonas pacifica]
MTQDRAAAPPDPACAPALAVVVKGYPRLSETFVAQELLALEARGFGFEIWSLRHPYDDRTHPLHDRIRARPRYLPEYLYQEPLRLLRAWRAARRLPGYRAARAAWLRDWRRDRTSNRGRRWGQALVLATELPAATQGIYVHFLHTPGSVARYAATMRGLPWAVSAHAKDIWTIPDWEKREKLAEAEFAVTCTASGAAELRRLAPAEETVELVYHGLDLSRFPDPPERAPGAGPLRLLSVGRLVAKKGYDDLLDALARLPAELDWRFDHIGGGELKTALAARAEALGIAPRIRWLGKKDQTEVVAAMRAADVFVLPSKIADDGDRDGLPNVLMEAASQRLPILSTAVSAIPEFVRDGREGRLVPPGDPQALAEALTALAADPQGRAAMAEAALARLRHAFGMEAGIDALESRLRSMGVAPAPARSAAAE